MRPSLLLVHAGALRPWTSASMKSSPVYSRKQQLSLSEGQMNNCRWMDGWNSWSCTALLFVCLKIARLFSQAGRERACPPYCESCNQWNGICVRASSAPSRGTLKFCCSVVLRCYAVSVLYFACIQQKPWLVGVFQFHCFFRKKIYLLKWSGHKFYVS